MELRYCEVVAVHSTNRRSARRENEPFNGTEVAFNDDSWQGWLGSQWASQLAYTPAVTGLDFEALRDALLFVSVRLDPALGGPSLDLMNPKGAKNVRRTIYAKVSRPVPDSLQTIFDFPDANATNDRRNVTTVPQQQLFLLNSDFIIECAKSFAALLDKAADNDPHRIQLAYRMAYGRLPSEQELEIGLHFLRTVLPGGQLTSWERLAQAMLAANEFAWVD